jgi:hypothetical protein
MNHQRAYDDYVALRERGDGDVQTTRALACHRDRGAGVHYTIY